jgi:hypothetical protein
MDPKIRMIVVHCVRSVLGFGVMFGLRVILAQQIMHVEIPCIHRELPSTHALNFRYNSEALILKPIITRLAT